MRTTDIHVLTGLGSEALSQGVAGCFEVVSSTGLQRPLLNTLSWDLYSNGSLVSLKPNLFVQ